MCLCAGGFFGDACNSENCNEHGKWSNKTNACDCDVGFSGEACNTVSCFGIDSKDFQVCSSHGQCTNPDKCQCTSSYFGEKCQLAVEKNSESSTIAATVASVASMIVSLLLLI